MQLRGAVATAWVFDRAPERGPRAHRWHSHHRASDRIETEAVAPRWSRIVAGYRQGLRARGWSSRLIDSRQYRDLARDAAGCRALKRF
jgi:hypothetical protein